VCVCVCVSGVCVCASVDGYVFAGVCGAGCGWVYAYVCAGVRYVCVCVREGMHALTV